MNTLRVLCLLSIGTVCSADAFIGPSAEGHQIIVPTNKVIYVESIKFNNYPTNISGQTTFRAASGQEVSAPWQWNITTYVPGPGELMVPRGAWVQFTILDNVGIQTKYLGSKSNFNVSLDTGQSIRWFRPFGVPPAYYFFTLTDADQRSVSFQAGDQVTAVQGQVTGPMTVTFSSDQSPMFFTYQIVSGGTNRLVNLQKSTDLLEWQTVDEFLASDEPVVLYRLDAKLTTQRPSASSRCCAPRGTALTALTPLTAARLQAMIPQARLEIIEDCGHMAPVEDPDAVAQIIGDFLRAPKK